MSYHFVTGDFTPQKVFLPDKEYGLALDALVKGCADVLLTRGAGASLRILLGKRKVEPQPDWWFVGGRTRPGDTPAEGAARNVKRELGLAIETRRFVHVNTYSFVWNYRQQAPSTNGTAATTPLNRSGAWFITAPINKPPAEPPMAYRCSGDV